ncbi:hypothetical protein HDU79_005118 [Rhizoclosmatium sp. JEL0117]|nr:hypothetical protein HDU79_005118 [Rhizoclosmatium sp. JEL0117]
MITPSSVLSSHIRHVPKQLRIMRSQCIPESAAPILKDFQRPIIAYQFLQNYADIKLETAEYESSTSAEK